MKKVSNLLILVAVFVASKSFSQVQTIVNYDFNSVSSYPVQPNTTETGVTCSGTSSEAFQTYTGAATGSSAFVQNSTSGNALAMANSGGTNTRYFMFQLGGSALNTYTNYSAYLQAERSSTGATTITVAYSTDGSSFTNLSGTYSVSTSFSEALIDLSSISALNNASAVYIKLMVSGASQTTGTFRMDNFQVQATKGYAPGTPWQVNGSDVTFAGKLDLNGDANFKANQTTIGDADFKNNLIARQGLTFDGVNGFRFSPATGSSKEIYTLGNGSSTQRVSTCLAPDQNQWFQMQGGYISRAVSGQINSSLTMMSAPWDGNGIIEVEGVGTGGYANNALMLNYFCGRNTLINVNNGLSNRGGKVIMGENVSMARYVGIGYNGTDGSISQSTALNIYANEVNQTALKLNVYEGTVKAIDLVNPGNQFSAFTVAQNGATQIKGANAAAFQVFNPSNGNALSFQVDADGGLTSALLSGTGTRQLYINYAGKLVAGTATVSSTNSLSWDQGGNTGTNSQAIGTLDGNADLPFLSGGDERMRLTAQGNLTINRKPSSVSNISGLTIGSAGGSNLNYGTSYIGLNTQRTSTNGAGSWTQYTDGAHNGGGVIFGNIGGDLSFSPMPSGASGATDATFTDADVMNHQTMKISWNSNTNAGQVFIGLKRPTHPNFLTSRLSVDGTIIAREIYVLDDVHAQWADYVFSKDYKLMPLNDVQTYINTNKHLPNVPSAKEVKEEGKGLGELQVAQMEKIEELYLYVLELNKKVEALEKENKELKETILKK